jgi:serine O-acetyltransferase
VKVYQGVTLGALSIQRQRTPERSGRYKRHPTIGDNVTIYSGANILGGNTVIGSGSVIGGNAWIVESVPPNSRIFGREREAQPSHHSDLSHSDLSHSDVSHNDLTPPIP